MNRNANRMEKCNFNEAASKYLFHKLSTLHIHTQSIAHERPAQRAHYLTNLISAFVTWVFFHLLLVISSERILSTEMLTTPLKYRNYNNKMRHQLVLHTITVFFCQFWLGVQNNDTRRSADDIASTMMKPKPIFAGFSVICNWIRWMEPLQLFLCAMCMSYILLCHMIIAECTSHANIARIWSTTLVETTLVSIKCNGMSYFVTFHNHSRLLLR